MDDVLQAALDGVDKALVDFTYESASEASSLSDDEGADPEMEENFGPIVFGAPAVAFDEAGDSDIDSDSTVDPGEMEMEEDDEMPDDDEPIVAKKKYERRNNPGQHLRVELRNSQKAKIVRIYLQLESDMIASGVRGSPTAPMVRNQIGVCIAKKELPASTCLHHIQQIIGTTRRRGFLQQYIDGQLKGDARRVKHSRGGAYQALHTFVKAFVRARRVGFFVVKFFHIRDACTDFFKVQGNVLACQNKTAISDDGILKILKRNNMKLKAPKKHSTKTSEEVRAGAQKLALCIYRCLETKKVMAILNADEIAGSQSGKMGRITTYTMPGDNDPQVNLHAGDFKRSCTILPCVGVLLDEAGKPVHKFSLPTWVIHKGQGITTGIKGETFDRRR